MKGWEKGERVDGPASNSGRSNERTLAELLIQKWDGSKAEMESESRGWSTPDNHDSEFEELGLKQ